jgi:proteasome accessory factor B
VDRLERLVNLVAALLDTDRPISRHELRARLAGYSDDDDAFRRNFERDKDLLRQLGMPLVVEPLDPARPEGPQGYRIPRERYELPDAGLAPDELAALHLAGSAVAVEGAWGKSAATTALWKLAGSAAGPETASADPAPAPPLGLAELPGGEGLAVLFGAVAARQRVRFDYRGEVREVDPWRLAYRNGQWYLTGFDGRRAEARTYRLDRMASTPEAVGEPGAFARPTGAGGAPPPPWLLGDEEAVVAELLVDDIQAEWAVAAVGGGAGGAVAERRSDGSVVLRITVTNRAAFRSFVLGFLDHAEVLAPASLRDDIVGWLEGIRAVSAPGDGSVLPGGMPPGGMPPGEMLPGDHNWPTGPAGTARTSTR